MMSIRYDPSTKKWEPSLIPETVTFTKTLWRTYLGCINANYDDFKVYTAFKFYVPDLDSKLI